MYTYYLFTGDELFKLVEYKVCRFLGSYLLRPVEKFNLDDFLRTWQDSVPEGKIFFKLIFQRSGWWIYY